MKRRFAEKKPALASAASKLFLALLLLALATMPGSRMAKADITIFSDNFTGSSLNPAWQVLAGQGTYSLAGDLRYFNEGPLSSPTRWDTTSLTLALPFTGMNWELDTKATYSLDWCTSGNNYTGPSVPNYSCSSGAQRPQVGISFAPVTASDRSAFDGPGYAYFDRGTDAYYGDNHLLAGFGAASTSGLLNPVDSAINNNTADGTYWYQFIRDGGTLTMNYSYDGIHYFTALSAPLPDPISPYNELLLSGTTYLTAGSFTDYAYFDITAPSAAPEPSAFVPLSLCFAGFGVGWIRRRRARR